MRRLLPAATLAFAAFAACAGELEVAREALRDGLWEIARAHAMADGGEEAKLVVQ